MAPEPFAPETPAGSVLRAFRPLGRYWTLHGGGAAAWHLKHRQLKELDFFRDLPAWDDKAADLTARIVTPPQMTPAERENLRAQLHEATGVVKIHFEKIVLSFVLGPKVSTAYEKFGAARHLPVCGMGDVMGLKFAALQMRDGLSDYVDLAAGLAAGWNAAMLLEAGERTRKIFDGGFDSRTSLGRMIDPPPAIAAILGGSDLAILGETGRKGLEMLEK